MEINESWALIIKDTIDLISHHDFTKISEIILNTSSQPNSRPHIGTATTILFNFALAKYFHEKTGVQTSVCFDQLENTPVKEINYKGETFYFYLDEGKAEDELDKNMQVYKRIFDIATQVSGIPYHIRSYKNFQNIPIVRETVIHILKNFNEFNKYLKFENENFVLRTKCPQCGIVKKSVNNIRVCNEQLIINSSCFEHGDYKVEFSGSNDTYISMGMQLRDLIKGVLCSEMLPEKLYIMCDSRDWGGEWNNIIHCMSKNLLKINHVTDRLFSPLVVDSMGRKISKTVYINGGYSELEGKEIFLDFEKFLEVFGTQGIEKIYFEVERWAKIPKKMVRNYSIEYIEGLFFK
ncbi:hypothetical protein JNE33_06330 [Streptococcus suis]|uniref:hypothetical protein n=1 Tax=Streptococcus suis TaxID=1307 RepID=UPI00192D984E|nr:hypothetical protein [Streptococcus suis]MBL6440124.1 hypothetical protein [Streptococcus suis]